MKQPISVSGWTVRVSRWLLGLWFSPAEVEEALADLVELRALRRRERGRLAGAIYYWVELIRYPVVAGVEAFRSDRPGGRARRGVGLREDIGYAIRSLVRRPWFAILSAGILTVTVAGTAAIFSVVKSVLIDGLPVGDPDHLVAVWTQERRTGQRHRMTPGFYTDVSALEDVFESVAAFSGVSATLLDGGEPEVLSGGRVTAGYFETLGVRPVLGRAFRQGEDRPGEAPVVILSHRVWMQRFGGDPTIVGRPLDFDGTLYEVVGVLPEGLYPASASVNAAIPFTSDGQDFFVPLRFPAELWANRGPHILGMIARLRAGVSTDGAGAALETLAANLAMESPRPSDETFLIRPFREEVVGDVRFGLLLLMGMVGLVMFIAASNVAALFVLRTDDRLPELTVRAALGASRFRLVRQMLLESTIVTGLGVSAGLLAAVPFVAAMRRMVPFQIPRLGEASVDGTVLLAVAGLSAGLAVTFGVASALGAARLSGKRTPTRARGAAGRKGRRRLQSSTVTIQVALSVIVLVGAALLTRSFMALRAVDPGFDATDAWVIEVGGDSPVIEEALQRIRALPGVAGAALAYDHPLERRWEDGFAIENAPVSPTDEPPSAVLRIVGEGWFGAAGIDVLEGRAPGRLDVLSSRGVAVVNQAFADRYLQGGPVTGRRVQVPSGRRMFGESVPEWFDIIGVVADVAFLGPDRGTEPALYLPAAQFPATTSRLLVRPRPGNPEILAAVRATLRNADPTMPLDDIRRMDAILDEMLARPRFNMAVLAAFAAIGITLCAMGIHGLVSRVLFSRTREIGIRIALGQTPASLLRSLLATAAWPAVVGIAAGLSTAIPAARLLRSLLFGITAGDPLTLVSVPLFVLLLALLASLAPTLRALRVDPATTLREE